MKCCEKALFIMCFQLPGETSLIRNSAMLLTEKEEANMHFAFQVVMSTINNTIINHQALLSWAKNIY